MSDTTLPAAELDLDLLAKLEKAATPGDWYRKGYWLFTRNPYEGHAPDVTDSVGMNLRDADLVCALRNNAAALIAAVATLRQDLTIVQDRHRELQHRYDELVAATAWRSHDEHPIPFSCVHLWLKDYTATYYGYRTNDGKWLMREGQRFVPVISEVQGWQYPPAVPDAEPLWKMQAASIAAEQIQELTAEVEQLRQQLSSAQPIVDVEVQDA
jgi:hypothetical protein